MPFNRHSYSHPSRLGYVLLATVCVVMVLDTGMNYCLALAFGFHPDLGEPWFGGLYPAGAWIGWFDAWGTSYQTIFLPRVLGFTGILLSWAGLAVYLDQRRALQPPLSQVYGSARWATPADATEAGLLATQGLALGTLPGRFGQTHRLCHDGPEHVAVLAPTRSGKTVSVVIPTLFSWKAAAVVYDQKGELWQHTAGWRAANIGPVYRFEPAATSNTFCYNPLDAIRLGKPEEIGDAQNLAHILIDSGSQYGGESHWTTSARNLVTGILLYVCYQANTNNTTASINEVINILTLPQTSIKEQLKALAENTFGEGGIPHQKIARVGSEFMAKPDKELGSIWSTTVAFLELYSDPIIARAMSESTLSFAEMVDDNRPVTVYLVTRESDKDRLKPLVRLFYTQLLRVLLRREAHHGHLPYRHRLLLLVDEFISLGKMDYLQEALSFIAGYGIRALLVLQDISQLHALYGKDEAIIANTHIRVVFAPNRLETAQWISGMLGKTTTHRLDRDTNQRKKVSEIGRELLTPDEIMRLQPIHQRGRQTIAGEQLVLVAGLNPFRCQQTPYFLSPDMANFSKIAPPLP